VSRYAQGRRYEYKTKDMLEEAGYSCTRSASSKGLWDVAAVRHDDVVLVQVKATKSLKNNYRDTNCRLLEQLPTPDNVRKEIWVWRVGRGAPEIHLL
jgi:Holliday junction resolvase